MVHWKVVNVPSSSTTPLLPTPLTPPSASTSVSLPQYPVPAAFTPEDRMVKGTLKTGQVLLTGHCDNRGEQEFNMSLGENRAEAVKTFLVGLGVPADQVRTSSRGKLDAAGQDEAGWANDRRVDVEVR